MKNWMILGLVFSMVLMGGINGIAADKKDATPEEEWISEDATYTASSRSEWSKPEEEEMLLSEEENMIPFCFHSNEEDSPFITVDLAKIFTVKRIEIVNRTNMCQDRAATLAVWISSDEKEWQKVWEAENWEDAWEIEFDEKSYKARYVKIGLQELNYFHLNSVKIYGY